MTAQEAAKLLLDGLTDPWHSGAKIPGFDDIKWHRVYDAMDKDHDENMEISGVPDWPSVLIAALFELAGEAE